LLWIIFAVAAGVVYIFDFPSSWNEGLAIVTSIALAAGISYGIYRSGLFGGADMLALITFSAIVPLYNFGPLVSLNASSSFHPFAPLIVLTNGVIFSVVQVLANVVRNAVHREGLFEGLQHEPTSRKIIAVLIGHRSANPKYAFPIERVVRGKRRFDFGLMPAETAEYETRKDVWVTSATPFLLFLAAGFVMMLIAGDLMSLALGLWR
ncbi:MAG TPA: A24 family peptidase C-terminal domain-containing protein, partial [Nitrososphaera sp.]|jgi:preflagellin peptidase FlaK|nr:A24 family peptidase C-terminal domain-containing protein [Nitrososphaera sp.]